MAQLLQTTADIIARHSEWASLVLGVTTFLESLVLIGAFVPATALMLLAGSLIAAGILDPVGVVVACVLGAVLGDAVSFALGRHLGARSLRHALLAPHRRHVARARLLGRRHGVVFILVSRFLGPVRAFAPLVLGAVRMRNRTFQAANVASALLWVPVMLAPGYLGVSGLARSGLAPSVALIGLATLLLAVAGAIFLVTALQRLSVQHRARTRPMDPAIAA